MSNQIFILDWKYDNLWNGCMLAAIAHAIMVARYPELSNEHSWDGINYNVQDSAGARGTITFNVNCCVAAFRNDNSDRLGLGSEIKEAMEYFEGVPYEILNLAMNETLQYVLDNINGKVMPVITTAFWGIDSKFFTNDNFDSMIANGAFLVERQLMDFDNAVESWKEYYDMSDEQVALMKSIYKRKLDEPTREIILTSDEINLIGIDSEEGVNESRISFSEIGIIWED